MTILNEGMMITGYIGTFVRFSKIQRFYIRGTGFLLLLLISWSPVKADKSELPPIPVISNEDSVLVKNLQTDSFRVAFDPGFKERYKGREFQYKSTSYPWAQRILRYIGRILEKIFGRAEKVDGGTVNLVINILMLLIFLIAVVTIIRLILGKDGFSLLFRREKQAKLSFAESGELTMHYSDLEKLIAQAISHQNFRLALRYQYVILLKKLNEKGFLEYHPEKTDSDYLLEVKDFDLKDLFSYIIYLYHRTWYGNHPINEMDYHLAKQSFNQMHKMLQNG